MFRRIKRKHEDIEQQIRDLHDEVSFLRGSLISTVPPVQVRDYSNHPQARIGITADSLRRVHEGFE